MYETIFDFAEAAATMNSDEIFAAFENDCPDNVRATIYHLGRDSVEPFRAACHKLGAFFAIESLEKF